MKWRKLGRVFECDGSRPWSRSHAAVPTVGAVDGSRVRVFYSTRDAEQRSHGAWFDLDVTGPKVVAACDAPVITPGPVGGFDDAGAMITWAEQDGADTRLYVVGWNLTKSVPMRNAVGLAVVGPDGGPARRLFPGPVMDRSPVDPCFVGTVATRRTAAGWEMWYQSCVEWRTVPTLRHQYHIKYATSTDGVDWRRDGTVCIDFRDDGDYAICRPYVIKDGPLYRMWFCYRGDRYRIGYAESADGRTWDRQDSRVGIDITPGEWDGEMVEYPAVFDAAGGRYMLYNGNNYGKTGLGLAVLEQD